MKQLLVSTVLLPFLLLGSIQSIESEGVSAAAVIQEPVTSRSMREVQEAEDARFAAMVRADTAALTGMLAHDLLYVHSSGRTETKAQFLNAVGSHTLRYLAFVPAERRVTLLDTAAAVIMGRANAKVITGGRELEFDIRYIGVYSRAGGRWRLRGWQTTRIPAAGGG